MAVVIERYAAEDPPSIDALRKRSVAEGHGLVERAVTGWADGSNRFDRNGEAFFLARDDWRVVGMCGLNVDPYLDDPRLGRIRHLYVDPQYRRRGIGSSLVESSLTAAAERFDRVRLRTFDLSAGRFYVSLGFKPVDEDAATHSLSLGR